MADLEIVAANLHNERASVEWLRKRSPEKAPGHYDLAMISEAHRRKRALSNFPGHRYATGREKGPPQETGILVGKNMPDLGTFDAFLSPAAPVFTSVGKERWGQVACTRRQDRKVTAICLHPVAGPTALAGKDKDHPLVERYIMAMVWLEAMIEYAEAMDSEWVVGSDIQMMRSWDTPWSPLHIFEKFRAKMFWHRIDVISVSRGLEMVDPSAVAIGSDHPALRMGVNFK